MRSMATKGRKKLVDIADSSVRIYEALENFLEAHSIPYTFNIHWADGFRRYYVDAKDLCCAQAVLPALQAMCGGDE